MFTQERFHGRIRDVSVQDVVLLQRILEQWIRDSETGEPIPDEVQEDMSRLSGSTARSNGYFYQVAEEREKIFLE